VVSLELLPLGGPGMENSLSSPQKLAGTLEYLERR
jgi:hypothetical protein